MAEPAKPKTSYTRTITGEQVARLRALLEREGFEFEAKPYALFAAKKAKLNVAVYEKGPKVLLQGKGTSEFVEFYLEPEILGVAEQGYEEVNHPEMFADHIGIDESGKGDFFGPLVIAAVFVNREVVHHLRNVGVQDSKNIGSDKRIREIADEIRRTPGIDYEVISIGPERYNELYEKAGNLNKMLAWGHARALENLLERKPECPRALSDQFAHERVLQKALLPRGKKIIMQQRTKGESDPAVAAASILARERFINWLRDAGQKLGRTLPRGASAVTDLARELVSQKGREILPKVAKMHFRTARIVLGLPLDDESDV